MAQLKSEGKLPYSPLSSVFSSTMEREGRTVTAYTSGQTFQAFMRRNDDGNNTEDRITLFYNINAPVRAGSIIVYGNKMYILINRETEENDCYYKSSAIALNGEINENNGSIASIPCYGYDMKNGLLDSNNVISVISGNMEFITEDNSLSRQLQVDQTFNIFGRTWKISNVYYKDGILHVITEVNYNIKPTENLQIVIDGMDYAAYTVGDSITLSATTYRNTEIISGSTITWTSSDDTVATIDGLGVVNFLAEGTVKFTALWVEKAFETSSNTVSVGAVTSTPEPTPAYTVTITGGTTIRVGRNKTWTCKILDSDGVDVSTTTPFTWNVSCDFEVTQTITDNKIQLYVDNEDAIDNMIILQVIIENVVWCELKIDIMDIF